MYLPTKQRIKYWFSKRENLEKQKRNQNVTREKWGLVIVWKSPNLLNNGCKTGEQEMSTYVSHIKQKQFLGFNLPICHFYPFFEFLPNSVKITTNMSVNFFFLQNKLHHLKLIKRKWVYIILVIVQSLLTLNTKYTTPQWNIDLRILFIAQKVVKSVFVHCPLFTHSK